MPLRWPHAERVLTFAYWNCLLSRNDNLDMKIISGGQTGVDRAALDVAVEYGIPYAGWCPKGGWAEDMSDPPGLLTRYNRLKESPLSDPRQRTGWNVRDADGLLILLDRTGLSLSKGTIAARDFAVTLGKPFTLIDLDAPDALERARQFLREIAGKESLCIAGPRESETPGIYAKAFAFLRRLLCT
jgi:hypothetical protein